MVDERVLVLLPAVRDTERTSQILGDAGLTCVTCRSLADVRREMAVGGGALVLTDEIISADVERMLEQSLRAQPEWSAIPVVVLAREGTAEHVHFGLLGGYNGVVVIERPVRTRSLVSAVQSSLRARRSQYRVRDAQAELAQQAEQLRTADRLKDEFLATLAHELRNPLAPISTGLSVLAGSDDSTKRERTLSVMQRQVGHMVRLIDDLLDVSRITRGKVELKRARVSLEEVIDQALEGSAPNIQRGQHRVVKNLPAEPLYLDADLTRLAQVVGNLLNNAAKYTPNGGTIELAVTRDGDEVVIAVSDNGIGIPDGHLDDVFQMFNQVNRVLDRSQGGLGIGLALVRRLVELHGGTVVAESDGPDMGSTFTVRLPLTDVAPSDVPPSVVVSVGARELQRVLVVDDNDDAAEMLSVLLQADGYTTITAHDGPSAIEAARRHVPDAIVLDIGLPGATGYEVAEELRRDARMANTALIALTGWGSPDDRHRAMAAGFDVHLTKPVASDDLKRALARATQKRKSRATASSPPR